MILHRDDIGWLVPFLLYLAITLRIIFLWVPITIITKPMHFVWNQTGVRIYNMIPAKLRTAAAALLAVAVFLVGSFVSEESADNTRANRAISLFGLVVMIALLWATSRARSQIKWHTVIGGMLTQFVIAVFVLRTQAGYDIFNFISTLARALLGFADQGTSFLTAESVVDLHWFITGVVVSATKPSSQLLLTSCLATNHFLRRSCTIAVLHRCPPMVRRQVRSLFLLESTRLWRRSGGCCCLPFHRTGRVGHADQAFCTTSYSG